MGAFCVVGACVRTQWSFRWKAVPMSDWISRFEAGMASLGEYLRSNKFQELDEIHMSLIHRVKASSLAEVQRDRGKPPEQPDP